MNVCMLNKRQLSVYIKLLTVILGDEELKCYFTDRQTEKSVLLHLLENNIQNSTRHPDDCKVCTVTIFAHER
jgi:hypothetical protein